MKMLFDYSCQANNKLNIIYRFLKYAEETDCILDIQDVEKRAFRFNILKNRLQHGIDFQWDIYSPEHQKSVTRITEVWLGILQEYNLNTSTTP